MADIPCTNRIVCPGPATSLDADDPIINFSSEAVDGINFSEMAWPINDFTNPFLPSDPNNPPDTCDSPISQEEAELCAITKVFTDQSNLTGRRGQIFFSGPQTCAYNCPDGSAFFWTVPPGAFADFSQSAADQRAKAFACQQVLQNAVCIKVDSTNTCLGANFLAVVTVDGGFVPYVMSIVAGTLPPGVAFVQDTNTTGFFSGVPTTAGNYPVAISARDSHGNVMSRTVTISVLGLNNPAVLPSGTKGTAYSYQLLPAGGTSPYVVTIISGRLPTGLTMDNTGLITGTPTVAESTNFTANVADSTGATCQSSFTVTANAVPCDASTNWTAAPGTCRLRIQGYVDGMFTACAVQDAAVLQVWDGTYSVFGAAEYDPDPKFGTISGKAFDGVAPFGSHIVWTGVKWNLQVVGFTGGVPNGMWVGQRNDPNPIGVYTRLSGCQPGPATITVEGYTP